MRGSPSVVVLPFSRRSSISVSVFDWRQRQFADLSTHLENIMQIGSNTFIVHCHTREHAEWLSACGLTFRSHLITFKPAANTQWVKLTRVRYGITEYAIKSRLSDFGTVLKIRHEKIHGIGISVYSVKIDLKQPIPSRITIAQSPVNVFYRGQVQQCFRCEQTGHLSRNCPHKPAVSSTSATVPVITAPVTTVLGPGVSTVTSTDSSATVSLPISDNALTSVSPVTLASSTSAPPVLPVETMDALPSNTTESSGLLPGKIPSVCARMMRPLRPRPRRTRLCLLFWIMNGIILVVCFWGKH